MIKQFLVLFTALFSLFGSMSSMAAPAPTLASPNWILVDRLTNTTLASKQENERINPGNSVLLMVIYTVEKMRAEEGLRAGTKVAVNNDALSIPPMNAARFYLEPNKSMTVEELMRAVAVMQANDAAIALAEGTCQTIGRFVEKMNHHAQILGMKNTHYTMPIGTKNDRQYTTVSDTLILANALLNEFPALADIWTIQSISNGVLKHKNSNPFLWRNSAFKGMHTSEHLLSNWTSVIFYSRDFMEKDTRFSRELLGIVMGTPKIAQHTDDTIKLMSWGADNYKTLLLYPAGQTIDRIEVEGADGARVRVGVKENVYVTLPRDAILSKGEKGFTVKLNRLDPLVSPIQEGEKIGDMTVYFNEKELNRSELIALHAVQRSTFWGRVSQRLKALVGVH